MKIIDKLLDGMGIGGKEDDGFELDAPMRQSPPPMEKEPPTYTRAETAQSNIVDFHSALTSKELAMAAEKMDVVVIEPKSFEESRAIADCLKRKRPVLVNFETTDQETARRILDFISGTTYAVAGEIQRVGRNVFLTVPSNVNVSNAETQRSKNDIFRKD